jgi:hypothetical protein
VTSSRAPQPPASASGGGSPGVEGSGADRCSRSTAPPSCPISRGASSKDGAWWHVPSLPPSAGQGTRGGARRRGGAGRRGSRAWRGRGRARRGAGQRRPSPAPSFVGESIEVEPWRSGCGER